MSPGIAVAVVPEGYYRRRQGVQFKVPFRQRDRAVSFAERHGCRVVIACETEDRYDVLCDPGSIPGPAVNFELVVDRGEMIAVPGLMLPHEELPELYTDSPNYSKRIFPKIAWNFVQSFLRA